MHTHEHRAARLLTKFIVCWARENTSTSTSTSTSTTRSTRSSSSSTRVLRPVQFKPQHRGTDDQQVFLGRRMATFQPVPFRLLLSSARHPARFRRLASMHSTAVSRLVHQDLVQLWASRNKPGMVALRHVYRSRLMPATTRMATRLPAAQLQLRVLAFHSSFLQILSHFKQDVLVPNHQAFI